MANLSDLKEQAPFAFRNKIMNGAMEVAQRHNGGPFTMNGGGTLLQNQCVLPDRWITVMYGAGLGGTVRQSSDAPAGFSKSYQFTTTSIANNVNNFGVVCETIEGYDVINLAYGTSSAKTVTLSFWVKSSLTGTFSGSWRAQSSSTFPWSYVFTYTINSANTWEYKTITIPGNTAIVDHIKTNGVGCGLFFRLGSNAPWTTSQINQWLNGDYHGTPDSVRVMSILNATFFITGVQVEIGSKATEFEHEPFDYTLKMCQRYFFQPIAQYTTNSTGNFIAYNVPHPMAMRTSTPTVSSSDNRAFNNSRASAYTTVGVVAYTYGTVTLSSVDAEFVSWVTTTL